jgi:predicted kinase/5'(3')-deoxyribonucleotidase
MAKLVITKGLPGSGKSFWAKEQVKAHTLSFKNVTFEYVRRVNKDDIRRELEAEGWVWSRENEKDVVRRQEALIEAAFVEGADTVICDDTNFGKHEARLRQLAQKFRADFEVKDFTDVPIDLCIQRDLARTGKAHVGEKVIRDMAEANLRPEQLVNRTGTPQLFLDLDGVLADFDGFIERELGIVNNRENEAPDFWDRVRSYAGRLYRDMEPLPHATELYQRLKPYRPVILTGVPFSLPTAAQDKREWVKAHIDPDVQVVTCKSRNKSKYMLPGDVLLDDWEKHKAAWTDKGGVWITFTGDVEKAVEEVTKAMSV